MMGLSLFIGRRFSKAKQRNKLVSFISASSVIGIAVGVMVIIIGLSAMNGFERELQNRVLSIIPHAELEGVHAPIVNWRNVQETAEQNSNVLGAAPYITFTALLENGAKIKPVEIKGIEPEMEQKVSDLVRYTLDDAWQALTPNDHRILLGKGIADALGVKKGDWVTAMLPSFSPDQKLSAAKRIRLQVIGVFSLQGQVDHGLAIVPLQDAQQYLSIENGAVSGVALRFNDALAAQTLVQQVGNSIKEYVYLKSWIHEYGFLYRDIQLVRGIVYIVMVLVIGVACFNVVSTLMMSVKDRAPDIAVLRTMGAKDGLIRAIFVWHGLLTGIVGSIFGAIAGGLISVYLTQIIQFLEKLFDHQFLSGDIYFVDFLPTELHSVDIWVVTITAILLSLLATWYPAQRACKLNPASVLSAK